VTVKLDEDPVFYESVKERLERIILERREQQIDDAEELRRLTTLREQMRVGRTEQAAAHGISAAAYPIYGILARNLEVADGAPEYGSKMPALAGEILEALRSDAVLDWQDKEDVKREMRRKVKRLLRLSGIEGEQVEKITVQIMDLARVRLR